MSDILHRLEDKQAMDFIQKIGDVFKSVPHLPKGLVEFFVMIAPWLALIGAIAGIFAGPLLAVFSFVLLLSLNPLLVVTTLVAAVLSVVNAILMFMAFKPLRNRQLKGWVYMFWGNMLGVAQVVLGFVLGNSSILSLIFAAIGVYILFEMKPFYSAAGKSEKA